MFGESSSMDSVFWVGIGATIAIKWTRDSKKILPLS